MECTIYRNDRILPIIVKEYFEEVRTNHFSWIKMPRRMLRHRVIQQCARLALGISAPDNSVKETNQVADLTEINLTQSRSACLKEQLKKQL